MKISNLVKLYQEVKFEAYKVSWPKGREVSLSVFLVCLASLIASLVFLFVDTMVYKIIGFIVGA